MGLDNVADIYIIETYKRQQQLRQTTWPTKKSQTRLSTATFNRHSWKHLRFSLLTFQPIAKKKLSKFLTIDASRLDRIADNCIIEAYKTTTKVNTMNRISEITLGKLLAAIDSRGSLSKAISIFWMEGLDRAGYAEHEIREHCEKLLS